MTYGHKEKKKRKKPGDKDKPLASFYAQGRERKKLLRSTRPAQREEEKHPLLEKEGARKEKRNGTGVDWWSYHMKRT